MNEFEFVKKYGWEEAQFLIDEWDGETTNWSLETGFVFVGKSVDTHMLCIETLKCLVDSHELVQSNGGIEMARQYLGNKNVLTWDALDGQLSQAICEVEKCL